MNPRMPSEASDPDRAEPMIYIAAIRRTGSVMLSEALTEPPHAYVLREPGFARGRFKVKEEDAEVFRGFGVDLIALRERVRDRLREGGGDAVEEAVSRVFPVLRQVVRQIGVKEIKHEGWRRWLEHLDDIRFVVTARDPRDVFLSLTNKARVRGIAWSGGLDAHGVAEEIRRQFAHQRTMLDNHGALGVRYEDLCLHPSTIERVKRFVGSRVGGEGWVGQLNPYNRGIHGQRIGETSVGRWRRESDPELRREAERVWALLPDYAEYWDYEP